MVSEPKLRILSKLAEQEMTYTQLKNEFQFSETAFLNHLKELAQAGLITKDESAKYTLTKKGYESLVEHQELETVRKFFEGGSGEPTFRELIDEILAQKGPMHYKDLTAEILKRKTTKGKTPDQTVLAILERGSRGEGSWYVHLAEGIYGLRNSPSRPLPYRKEDGNGYVQYEILLDNFVGNDFEVTVDKKLKRIYIRTSLQGSGP